MSTKRLSHGSKPLVTVWGHTFAYQIVLSDLRQLEEVHSVRKGPAGSTAGGPTCGVSDLQELGQPDAEVE